MPPTDSERIALLRSELAIRVFEEAVEKQLADGLRGSVHLDIGHEGAIAGGCAALAGEMAPVRALLGTIRRAGPDGA